VKFVFENPLNDPKGSTSLLMRISMSLEPATKTLTSRPKPKDDHDDKKETPQSKNKRNMHNTTPATQQTQHEIRGA
jgi:hypothetical protein